MSHNINDDVFRANGLLIIGGASRNVGKTTLISNIIRHFAKSHHIIGLKVKTIYEGDSFFHGNTDFSLNEDFRLVEEFENENEKDSSGMLKAGAIRAFRLKVHHQYLLKAYKYFMEKINGNYLVICESNSLRKAINPDLFMMIKHHNNQNMKPSALEMEKFADKIIITDGIKHDFLPYQIDIENLSWILKN
jgi:hypothetical protein